MTRSIVPLDGGRYETVRYSKTLYDKGHGNTVVMHSDGPARSSGPRPLPSSRGSTLADGLELVETVGDHSRRFRIEIV